MKVKGLGRVFRYTWTWISSACNTSLKCCCSSNSRNTKNIQLESVWCNCSQSLWLLLPLLTENSAPLCSSVSDYSSLCHFDLWLHQTHWFLLLHLCCCWSYLPTCIPLHLLSSCCIALSTAALQLSYWEVSKWSPNWPPYWARTPSDAEAPSAAPSAFVSTHLASPATPCRGSHSKV